MDRTNPVEPGKINELFPVLDDDHPQNEMIEERKNQILR